MYITLVTQLVDGLGAEAAANVEAVIWTTTPWTIPANLALAVHPQLEYAVVEATASTGSTTPTPRRFLVATSRVDDLQRAVNAAAASGSGETATTALKTIAYVPGAALEGTTWHHPLYKRSSKMIVADYVTEDSGTGYVGG